MPSSLSAMSARIEGRQHINVNSMTFRIVCPFVQRSDPPGLILPAQPRTRTVVQLSPHCDCARQSGEYHSGGNSVPYRITISPRRQRTHARRSVSGDLQARWPATASWRLGRDSSACRGMHNGAVDNAAEGATLAGHPRRGSEVNCSSDAPRSERFRLGLVQAK